MDLQKQFAEGDPAAFELLFRTHQHEVYRWILRLVRNPAAAEDLTLETFWRAHRAARRFDPSRSFGAWLRRIATNVARKHLARQRPETIVEDLSRYAAASAHDPSHTTNAAIREAFQRLPETLRSVALLAFIEEMPQAEIAQAMGLSLSAVKTRIFRAARQLRGELSRQGIHP